MYVSQWGMYICVYMMGDICVYVSQGGMYVCVYVYVIKGMVILCWRLQKLNEMLGKA